MPAFLRMMEKDQRLPGVLYPPLGLFWDRRKRMLICPFCQFENVDSLQGCQQCGESLPTWFALCLPHNTLQEPLSVGPFLDPGQRYRLSKSATVLRPARATAIRVVDCQPEQASPLQDLRSAWLENPRLEPQSFPLAQATPSQAFPYLALQAELFPAVPELHDTFRETDYTALLIEDRTAWPTLIARWQQAGQDDALQQIQWLFEIALLWEGLLPWQMEASLLNIDRLVISDNDVLCLTYLGPNAAQCPVPLKRLGESWQKLAANVDGFPEGLNDIVFALTTGRLETINALKDALANLAEQWAAVASAPLSSPVAPEDAPPNPAGSSSVPATDLLDAKQTSASGLAQAQGIADKPQFKADEKADPPDLPTMVLPMKLVQVDEVGLSHVGMQRNHNEDYFFARTHTLRVNTVSGATLSCKGLYIVCDGMGGHAAGEVASQLAVQALVEYFDQHWLQALPDQHTLTDAVHRANQVIYDINQSNATSGLGRMGTTLVMLLVQDLSAAVVHVGDSRLYSFCKRLGLRQLTSDHEVGQREINRGIEPDIAYARPDAYQLTQALGPRHQEDVKPAIAYHDIAEDTLFLLCSDGLSDKDLLDRYETTHIAPLLSSKTNLENGLAELIDLANEENGHDNITAVLTRLKLRPDMRNLPR